MKAAYYEGNKTFSIRPSTEQALKSGEVRIAVSFAGICGTDLHIYHGAMDHRLKPPQIPGHEMSGKIVEMAPDVAGWKVGDRVVVRPLVPCGKCAACKAGHGHICMKINIMGVDSAGAFQSMWNVPAFTLHRLPDALSMRHAAMIEPLAVACHDVRLGGVKPGERVVVIGGGPIGMLIGMVARHAGADVTLSEISPFRIELARKLGFDAIDPRSTDLVTHVNALTDGAGADVVFEVSGSLPGVKAMTAVARTRGRVVVVAIFPKPVEVDLMQVFLRELHLLGTRVYEPVDFDRAIELAASGAIPLEELITAVKPMDELPATFAMLDVNKDVMKVLIECG